MEEVKAGTEFEYSKELGAIIDSDGEKGIVFYTEDINPEVIEAVVELWNDGTSVIEIVAKLAKRFDDICTSEEREYIQTQIENWEKVSSSAVVEKKVVPVVHKSDTMLEIIAEVGKEQDTTKDLSGIAKHEGHLQPELTKGQRAAATRKANSAGKVSTGGGKKVDAGSVIEKLKAQAEKAGKQIAMVQFIEDVHAGEEFPDGLVKDQIELLIKFSRAIEAVKNEYITAVQEL